jgi:hypothetical protein
MEHKIRTWLVVSVPHRVLPYLAAIGIAACGDSAGSPTAPAADAGERSTRASAR